MTAPTAESAHRPTGGQAFWSVVVAVPAALSLMRLWIEAGGQLQTTLLIVENVNTVNLFTTMFLTGTPLVTMALVAIFAIGSTLSRSAVVARDQGRPLRRWPLFARWTDATPLWLLAATFAMALATWQILYLPLLLPALMMTFQDVPAYRDLHLLERLTVLAAVLAGYLWTIWPALAEAVRLHEYVVAAMFVVPPLVMPAISGPLPRPLARVLTRVGQPTVVLVGAWAVLPVLSMPVLPLTVTTVTQPDRTTAAVRGHIINTDDQLTAILQESGGVRYVRNDTVVARVLCPSPEELPVYQLRVRDFHIEDSLLVAWGRRVRPVVVTDAACRDERPGPSSFAVHRGADQSAQNR